jgi:ATP-dependent DNA helicase PIF1
MSLQCACSVEWFNAQGIVLKRFKSSSSTLLMTRNDFRDIFIDLTADKSVVHRFLLKDIAVHKRFASDGKATINFKSDKAMLMISNAPVSQLADFLKTLFIKVTAHKDSPQVFVNLIYYLMIHI